MIIFLSAIHLVGGISVNLRQLVLCKRKLAKGQGNRRLIGKGSMQEIYEEERGTHEGSAFVSWTVCVSSAWKLNENQESWSM